MITAALRSVGSLARTGLVYRNYVLFLLMLIFAVQYLDRQVVVVLAQPIKEEFALSDKQMGLITGFVYSIPYSLMLIPMGMLTDRGNRRNNLALGLGLWSCLTFVTGFIRTLPQLILIRIAVAATESINHPSSLSIIADLFDRSVRATAVGVFFAGPAVASVFGYPLIALAADTFGWRAGFFAAGVPGLLLALIIYFTTREPKREASRESLKASAAPSLKETFAYMWLRRSTVYLMLAMMLTSVINSGQIMWMVAFLMRGHDFTLSQAALAVSLAFGLVNAFGHLFGGAIIDRLVGRRGVVWFALGPAICATISLIFQVGSALVPQASWAVAMLAVWAIAAGFQYGPVLGTIQTIVQPRMRGVASACMMFLVNLVGAGLGPLLIGALSDAFEPQAGHRSLQVALAAVPLLQIVVTFFFLLAARRLDTDMNSATAKEA